MNWLAIGLVVASAFIHSIWNLLSKKSENKVVFNWCICFFSSIIYFPVFLYFIFEEKIPFIGWKFIIFSGVLNAIYFYFLAKSYTYGNFSLTYPLSRSSIIFIPILAFLFIGETSSFLDNLGILIIVIGIYILHLKSLKFGAFLEPLKSFKDKSTIFALLTALFSAGYSVVDKVGVNYVSPFLYIYLILFVVSIVYFPVVLSKNNYKSIKSEWKINKKSILLSGFFAIFSYVLILFALQIEKVSFVFAFRQLSVLFGVIFGYVILREKHGAIRLLGALVMVIGFLLLSI